METTKETILDYLKKIKPELEKYGIEKIALFGSFATGTENVYSDIDIAVKKKNGFFKDHTAYDYFEIVSKLRGMILQTLHRNSDVLDLDSNSEFADTIKKELIYV